MSKEVTLKIKNGTMGDYRFQFRHPRTGKLATVTIPPLATMPVIIDDIDTVSAVRLQYPLIPDNSDVALSDIPVQFVWEGVLPTFEDYEGSLAIAEQQGAEEGKAALEEAVNQAAEVTSESIPDAKSGVTVRKAGSKSSIDAQGANNG